MKKILIIQTLFILVCLSPQSEVFAKPSKDFISADRLLKDESSTLEPASVELIKFAKKASEKGYHKLAYEAASLLGLIYPRDPELAKLIESYNKDNTSEAPEDFLKEKEKVYSKAANYLIKYGDSLLKYGGSAFTEWAYKIAEKMGTPPDKKKIKELEKPLEEFNKTLKEIISDEDKGGLLKAPATGYEYRFRLPGGWSIDNEWPVLFVFHGTGGAWGKTNDTEKETISRWDSFASGGKWIIISIREPSMIKGHHPDSYNTVDAMEEILAIMAIRYRANPQSVALATGGSGALCCWPYLEKHPERLCAIEICMGKFEALGVKKGSKPAVNIPVRIGIRKNPDGQVGTSNTTQAQHDQVHIGMMMSAKTVLEKLGFTKLEWFPENMSPGDKSWLDKCAEEKTRRCKSLQADKK